VNKSWIYGVMIFFIRHCVAMDTSVKVPLIALASLKKTLSDHAKESIMSCSLRSGLSVSRTCRARGLTSEHAKVEVTLDSGTFSYLQLLDAPLVYRVAFSADDRELFGNDHADHCYWREESDGFFPCIPVKKTVMTEEPIPWEPPLYTAYSHLNLHKASVTQVGWGPDLSIEVAGACSVVISRKTSGWVSSAAISHDAQTIAMLVHPDAVDPEKMLHDRADDYRAAVLKNKKIEIWRRARKMVAVSPDQVELVAAIQQAPYCVLELRKHPEYTRMVDAALVSDNEDLRDYVHRHVVATLK